VRSDLDASGIRLEVLGRVLGGHTTLNAAAVQCNVLLDKTKFRKRLALSHTDL